MDENNEIKNEDLKAESVVDPNKEEDVNNQKEIENDKNQKRIDDDKKINELVSNIIGDESEERKFKKALDELKKKIGLLPLESSNFKPTNKLDFVIYTMRWNPEHFFECSIDELHAYEMVLCAHICWVKGRENRWMSAYKIEKQSFDRAVAQAAKFCSAKSISERQAEAISRNDTLQKRARTLEIYKLYADHCSDISTAFIQMDNSLKKMIDTRRLDYESFRKGV